LGVRIKSLSAFELKEKGPKNISFSEKAWIGSGIIPLLGRIRVRTKAFRQHHVRLQLLTLHVVENKMCTESAWKYLYHHLTGRCVAAERKQELKQKGLNLQQTAERQ
jgi:hypothetical protein